MAAKFIFLAGVLGIGGYVAHSAMNYDPAIVPMSKDQARDILVEAKTVLPRKDNDGFIRIWSEGRTKTGVKLAMQYSETAPKLTCRAVIEAIDANQTRVVPDCGAEAGETSALARTTDELRVPMFEEHIQATLHKRDFNRDRVDSKEVAVVFKNMGGMQREALKTADEFQRMEAESRSSN